MALVALLFAHHTLVGATEPYASMTVAGLSSLERQVHLVRAAGAERVLVVAERMPPQLAAVLARLAANVTTVRDPALLGASLNDGDCVLVLEEGLLPDEASLGAFVASAGHSAIATATGEPLYRQAERLDAASFWAGVAIYEARLVRAVTAELGEWDLQSTLLRFAVGDGVPRLPIVGAVISVRDARDAEQAGDELIAASNRPRRTWPVRYLYPVPERLAVRALLPTRATSAMLWAAALAAGALAIAAFASGWLWLGLLLALLADPLSGMAESLAAIKLQPSRREHFDRAMALLIEPGWYLGLAVYLAEAGYDGAVATAALIIAFRIAADRQEIMSRTLADGTGEGRNPRERQLALLGAAPQTAPFLLLPFAIVGAWQAGFIGLAIHAVATFFVGQAFLFRRFRS